MRVDGTRYYVLKDHLGSASVVTNQSATVVGQDRFMPFGETRFTPGLGEGLRPSRKYVITMAEQEQGLR